MTAFDDTIDQVTADVIASLEEGVMPWRSPIDDEGNFVTGGWPFNPVTGTRYGGLNAAILLNASLRQGYDLPRWLTYAGAERMGGQVRAGEKATRTIGAALKPVLDKKGRPVIGSNGKPKETIIRRTNFLFNARQIDGLPERYGVKAKAIRMPDAGLDAFVANIGATIHQRGDTPCYYHKSDTIHMPRMSRWTTSDDYYAVLFHELAHWTKKESRVDRVYTKRWLEEALGQDIEWEKAGQVGYDIEELVAEMASAYMCSFLGIRRSEGSDHSTYCAGYIRVLKTHPGILNKVAKMASDAAAYLIKKGKGSETALVIAPDPLAKPFVARAPRVKSAAKLTKAVKTKLACSIAA